jgi:hypothetical protein
MSDRSGRSVLHRDSRPAIGNKALSVVSRAETFLKPPLTNWAKSAGQETSSDEGQFRLVHIRVRWQQRA